MTATNCVSVKVKVWTRPGWLVSSVPSSFTSTTWSRGWYLWRDWRTTIWRAEQRRASETQRQSLERTNNADAKLFEFHLICGLTAATKDTSDRQNRVTKRRKTRLEFNHSNNHNITEASHCCVPAPCCWRHLCCL